MTGKGEIEAGRDEQLLLALRTLASDPAIRLYAVMDGALLDDLPGELQAAGLWAASLVAEGAGRDLVAAGPWLVDPNLAPVAPSPEEKPAAEADEDDLSDEALDRRARAMAGAAKAALEAGEDASSFASPAREWREADPAPRLEATLRLAAGSPGVVFWCGGRELTSERLFQHLRGLGKVRRLGADRPAEGEMVLFRHADADVMAQVLPALGPAQFSRFLGPAERVLFAPGREWAARFGQAVRTPDLPLPPTGPLVIDAVAIEAIERSRSERSRRRIAAYLREAAPDRTTDVPEEALMELTRQSDLKAAELGIRTERGRGFFSYLMLLTGGKAGDMPEVRAIITNGQSTPDNQVRRLMRESAGALRRQGAAS